MAGLVLRPRHQYARMGVDGVAVVVIYLVGVAGLASIAR